MKRILAGTALALVVAQLIGGLVWADFGISNFRMSDQANGPKMNKFPAGITTAYVMFDYTEALDMPIQVRVYDPRGQVIFQETKNYNGSGSETMTVQLSEGVPFEEGDYVTNIFQRQELYLTESLEWTVGQPSSQPPAQVTAIAIQVRTGTRSESTSQPMIADRNGEMLHNTSVFATVVRDSARMNAMNMVAHSTPEIRPGRPMARMRRSVSARYCTTSTPVRNRTMKNERQKVTSQPSRTDWLRTSTPAVAQHSVAPSMSSSPRR